MKKTFYILVAILSLSLNSCSSSGWSCQTRYVHAPVKISIQKQVSHQANS